MQKVALFLICVCFSAAFARDTALPESYDEKKVIYHLGEYRIEADNLKEEPVQQQQGKRDVVIERVPDEQYVPSVSIKSTEDVYSFVSQNTENRLTVFSSHRRDYNAALDFSFSPVSSKQLSLNAFFIKDSGHRDHNSRKDGGIKIHLTHEGDGFSNDSEVNYKKEKAELPFYEGDEANYFTVNHDSLDLSYAYTDNRYEMKLISVKKRKNNATGISDVDASDYTAAYSNQAVFHGRAYDYDVKIQASTLDTDSFSRKMVYTDAVLRSDMNVQGFILTPSLKAGISSRYSSYIAPSVSVRNNAGSYTTRFSIGRDVKAYSFSDLYFSQDYVAAYDDEYMNSSKKNFVRVEAYKKQNDLELRFFYELSRQKDMMYYEESLVPILKTGFSDSISVSNAGFEGKTSVNNTEISARMETFRVSDNIPYIPSFKFDIGLRHFLPESPFVMGAGTSYTAQRYYRAGVSDKTGSIIDTYLSGEYRVDGIKFWVKASNIFNRDNYERFSMTLPGRRYYMGLEWLF